MSKDTNPVINVAFQELREALSATRSFQNAGASIISNLNSYEYKGDKTDASNLQHKRMKEIDNLNKATDILKNTIFVLMTILSISILVTQGSVCISK